jgi:hypothetical protein
MGFGARLRTMGEALMTEGFSREELTFVTGGEDSTPTAHAEKPKTDRPTRRPKARAVVTSITDERAPDSAPGSTVSMTFRLPADLPAQLIRTSAERRVQRKNPSSQQAIVAEALKDWFERHG